MSYIRYKTFGNKEYAYNVMQIKDEQSGKYKQKQEYLGVVVDKEAKIFEKRNNEKRISKEIYQREKLILDYGDTYLADTIIKRTDFMTILEKSFLDNLDTALSLIFYRIQGGSAMRYTENWYYGNIARLFYPKAKISTQAISEFLKYIGNEQFQRKFFKNYISSIRTEKTGLLIDSTGLPNEIQFPLTNWGHHNGGIEKETRLILAVDKDTNMPLYFRYVAGNICDVSTLITTIEEIKTYGVNTTLSIVDAGYFSEANIKALFAGKISFLTRMPSSRKIYKELISTTSDIENIKYIIKYNKRGLFIKRQIIRLYENPAFAYIVCDPERRGKEISKKVLNLDEQDDEVSFTNCGMMILVSDIELSTNEVIPLYYTRQMAEQLFGISKDDLNILPIRTHSEDTFRGFMFLTFISLIVYIKIKDVLGKDTTIEQAFSCLRNLKCKVFDDLVLVSEATKQQRMLFEHCNVIVPKHSGV